jgi:hypothetical protein
MAIEVESPDGSIVEFPDGTSNDVMKSAMQKRFGGGQAAPAKKQAEMRSYEPTWREKISNYLLGDERASPERERLVTGITGSRGLPGTEQVGVIDFTRARIPLYAQEAVRNYNEGNYGQAALSALGATPVPLLDKAVGGIASGVSAIGRKALEETPRSRIVEAAMRQGINVPRGAITSDIIQPLAGSLADAPIVGAPLRKAARKGAEETTGALERTMTGLGRTSADESGQVARDAIQSWIRGGSSDELSPLYKAIDDVIPETSLRPLTATKTVVDDIEREMARSTSRLNAPAVDAVREAVNRPGGMSYQGLKQLRTDIGARIDDADPAAGTIKPALRRLYGSLSDDLTRTVEQYGGKEVLGQFQVAEEAARNVGTKRDQLRKIIGGNPDATSGESVIDALVRRAGSKSTADIDALTKARSVIGNDDWGAVSGEAVARLARDQSNELNMAAFRKNYLGLSEKGRDQLFGPAGSEIRQALDDIAEVARAFKQMERMGNPSGSGRLLLGAGMLTGGIAVGVVPGLKIAVPAYVTARIWSRPATARSAARVARAALADAQAPSQATQAALRAATQELERQLTGMPGLEKREKRAPSEKLTNAMLAQKKTEEPPASRSPLVEMMMRPRAGDR